jgi:hypothetical protein
MDHLVAVKVAANILVVVDPSGSGTTGSRSIWAAYLVPDPYGGGTSGSRSYIHALYPVLVVVSPAALR